MAPRRAPRPRVDNAMVKALARAFRWRKVPARMRHSMTWTPTKGVASSYTSRVLRLTLLSPDIVEAILDGRQRPELQLENLLGFRWTGGLISPRSNWTGQLRRARRSSEILTLVRIT